MFWYALMFELSYWMSGGIIQYEPLAYTAISEPFLVSLGAEAGYGPLSAYGSVATDMWATDLTAFSFFMNTYTVGVRAEFGPVTVGLEHSCFHPAVPYQWIPARQNVVPSFEGSFDRIYVQIKLGGRR